MTLRGKRHPVRRLVSLTLATASRSVDATPVGRWWRRRLVADPQIHEVDVTIRRGGSIEGLRIAFFSDLHAGHFLTGAEILSIAERVAALQPDLVCLGGDLINTRIGELAHCTPLWDVIAPPLGVYAVPGNHDHFGRRFGPRWRAALRGYGVPVLTNRGVRLQYRGATFWLCGIDDMTEGEPDLDAALVGRGDDEPTILLSHHPDAVVDAAEHGVDLQLSGHTHGGQLRLFGWAPLNHSEHGFLAGLYRHGISQLYVGRGLGVTVVPLRIGARPEVPILRLRG